MKVAIFWAIPFLIFVTHLFLWRRAWQIYDGIGPRLLDIMFALWTVGERAWLVPLILFANLMVLVGMVVVPRFHIHFPDELVWYAGLVTFFTASWNLMPPAVLFLANSREEAGRIVADMKGGLLAKGMRVAYLLDPAAASLDTDEGFMDNFRTMEDSKWERAVHTFMQIVPIIAIDVRAPSPGVIRETQWIFQNGVAHKTVFITEPDGGSEILERRFPSPRQRSMLMLCAAKRVLEPLTMLVENKLRSRKPLKWES